MEKSSETGKIAIVYDSGSSLPENFQTTKYGGLVEVPLVIIGGDDEEQTDHSFESDEEREKFVFYLKRNELKTSQPNSWAYKNVFENITKTGVTEIAVVPMSNRLSGSMGSAQSAAWEFRDKANVVVADCKTVSIGQGLLITQANIENRKGEFNNAKELVNRVEKLSKELYVTQALPSLEYLIKGGRIGRIRGGLARLAGITPVVGVSEDGQLESIAEKPKGWQHTREAMIDYVSKEVGHRAVRLAILYFRSNQLDNLRNDIKDRFVIATDDNGKEYDVLENEQRMGLGVYSGPETISFGALALDKIN
ncbi:MAG TPA: DegV family protein [Candidatus Angelobacter sp.]|nr:DegV family protein [Candidatus Angelobacter sp.]